MDDLYLSAADQPGPGTEAWFNAVAAVLLLSVWASACFGIPGGLLVLVTLPALLVQLQRRRRLGWLRVDAGGIGFFTGFRRSRELAWTDIRAVEVRKISTRRTQSIWLRVRTGSGRRHRLPVLTFTSQVPNPGFFDLADQVLALWGRYSGEDQDQDQDQDRDQDRDPDQDREASTDAEPAA